jgi:Primase C terminal 1 (PriCT-1)
MVPRDNASARSAVQYFAALHPRMLVGERIELRLKALGGDGPMHRSFLPTPEEAAEAALSFSRTHDVYAGVATRRGEDGTKAGICRTRALWADLDAKDGHTRQSRLEQLMVLPCHPSMLVWTGGGWHAYWLLIKPVENSQELERAEQIMRRLALGLDADPVHDISRILRVSGTFNFKYGEPRPVVLERYNPDVLYKLVQLEEMTEALPDLGDSSISDGKVPNGVLGEPIREGGRNVTLASVAGSLRNRGLDVESIAVVLLEVNRVRCEPTLPRSEVLGIARSIGRYAPGKPRYRRSPVRRVSKTKER